MRGIWPVSIGVLLLAALGWQARGVLQAEPPPAPAGAVATKERIRAEGRLVTYPGGEVTVSPEVEGRIVRLTVEEGARVRAGQLLAELGAEVETAALAEARAGVAEADAALRLAESEAERQGRLRAAEVVSVESLDRVLRERDAARARRELAAATVERVRAQLEKRRIVAPIGGVVISRVAELGETIPAGAPMFVIADLGHTRIEAEVDEFDSARLRVGAMVVITGEGYPGSWRGRVEEIPDAVTARRLKPQDPGRPTDTRVLIVKVALDEAVPLRLGQRVEVEIGGGS
jgi:HlyD family secretion protein